MNVVTLTGHLTADPVRRDTTSGVVCEFRLAVDSRPRLWISVEVWGHLAGRCAQHLRSGRHVALTGRLCHDEFVTRSGDKADRWYAKAHQVTFLDRPNESVEQ